MKLSHIFLAVGTVLLAAQPALAGELQFPESKDEMIKALKFQNATTEHEGKVYEVTESGEKFLIYKGKRYRMRGIGKIVDSDIVPKIGARIQFPVNGSAVQAQSFRVLDQLAEALKDSTLSDSVIQVSGHTDTSGDTHQNMTLSQQRADAVKGYLISRHGISPNRLISKGYGESKPLASNADHQGRSQNRRVEFIRIE
ncbi:MAG: OmpA family protein [Magnetococcales bacterium]|nr:OmpA family protein [Magnetococcales bacterium]